jgi:hypothetical protein
MGRVQIHSLEHCDEISLTAAKSTDLGAAKPGALVMPVFDNDPDIIVAR